MHEESVSYLLSPDPHPGYESVVRRMIQWEGSRAACLLSSVMLRNDGGQDALPHLMSLEVVYGRATRRVVRSKRLHWTQV